MPISRRKFIFASSLTAIAMPGAANLISGRPAPETNKKRDESLWTKSISESLSYDQLESDQEADLVIVGGGYTGLSCAYYAKQFRPDWRVVILEAQKVGSGASSRNSGAVYAKYVGLDDQAVAERGLQRFRNFIDTNQIDCDFRSASTLSLYHSKRSADKAKTALKVGESWIAAEKTNELTSSPYYTGAVSSPDYFKIDPAKLLLGKSKAATSAGVEIYEHSPVIDIEHGKPVSVKTSMGTVKAQHVLIATNGYTPRLELFNYKMFPIHQFTLSTRQLSNSEIQELGLHLWDLRFEPRTLPVTFSLSPSGHFFMRMVLGYAHNDSAHWNDTFGALRLAKKMFLQRYPSIEKIGFDHYWHGITGHTINQKPIMGAIGEGNVHVSVAYNGLGIMPAHNNGYLTACKITNRSEDDVSILDTIDDQISVPRGYYRSMILKPGFNMLMPI